MMGIRTPNSVFSSFWNLSSASMRPGFHSKNTTFSIFWNLSSAGARPDFIKKRRFIFILEEMLRNFCYFATFWEYWSRNPLFRKHLLGVLEPPKNNNERYFSHVFQLFVGAKPNSCFLGRKNFVVGKRLTRKLTFPSKVCLFGEKRCLFE